MKKTVIIIIIVLGVLAMGSGIYFAWRKTSSILTPPLGSSIEGGSFSVIETDIPENLALKMKILNDQPALNYLVFQDSENGESIFYLNNEGMILKTEEDKDDEIIVQEPIENIQSIKASADGKRMIIKSGDLSYPNFVIFNVEERIFEVLPENITSVDFSPDAESVAYLKINGEKSDLIIKNLINTKQKDINIISIYQKDFNLDWISSSKIVLSPKFSAFNLSSNWIVDISKKTINLWGEEAYGLITKWAQNGEIGLRFSSRLKGREAFLNLINIDGQIRANISFLTLPQKCFIADPKIYCAIPNSIPSKTVLPDDYFKKAFYSIDSFYQIDVNENSLLEIFTETDPAIDAINLNLVGDKLYFINRYDNGIYSLEL
ncbi:hypothetical protein JW698_00980 [Candidatus Wolfebacteria bacterium]|nr:hypothetical protein [Candidatus Wolfebacteria bacterium]